MTLRRRKNPTLQAHFAAMADNNKELIMSNCENCKRNPSLPCHAHAAWRPIRTATGTATPGPAAVGTAVMLPAGQRGPEGQRGITVAPETRARIMATVAAARPTVSPLNWFQRWLIRLVSPDRGRIVV